MTSETWPERFYALAMRFSHLGITPDFAGLTLTEMWGLYCLLARLAGGEP